MRPAPQGRLAVVYQPLASLVPYARNARRHSPGQIAKIKASLAQFGWANAMLVADQQMIAGHARLAAALALLKDGTPIPFAADPAEGPTIDLSHLSVPQRRAYVLADNRLAEEALWDLDLLRDELGELASAGFDLTMPGFDAGELDTIMQGWNPDLGIIQRTEAGVTDLLAYVRVRCTRQECGAVEAAIRGALAGFPGVVIDTAR